MSGMKFKSSFDVRNIFGLLSPTTARALTFVLLVMILTLMLMRNRFQYFSYLNIVIETFNRACIANVVLTPLTFLDIPSTWYERSGRDFELSLAEKVSQHKNRCPSNFTEDMWDEKLTRIFIFFSLFVVFLPSWKKKLENFSFYATWANFSFLRGFETHTTAVGDENRGRRRRRRRNEKRIVGECLRVVRGSMNRRGRMWSFFWASKHASFEFHHGWLSFKNSYSLSSGK